MFDASHSVPSWLPLFTLKCKASVLPRVRADNYIEFGFDHSLDIAERRCLLVWLCIKAINAGSLIQCLECDEFAPKLLVDTMTHLPVDLCGIISSYFDGVKNLYTRYATVCKCLWPFCFFSSQHRILIRTVLSLLEPSV
jgi:hypothetical protein